MKYLNLTEGFNPYSAMEHELINFTSNKFNGGEPHIKIQELNFTFTDVMITSRVTNMDEFILIPLAVDALRATYQINRLFLFIPYFPGSRQDRRMVNGEPLTSKVFAEIINGCEFDIVYIMDNHSDVISAVLNNCVDINNHKFVISCLRKIHTKNNEKSPYLISPDAGAQKKIYKLSAFLNKINPIEIVKCDKERDVTNGNLSGFTVYADDLERRSCVICDDIADGGGTFLGLANELKKKNAGDLYLIVTHGIFSAGFKNGLAKKFIQQILGDQNLIGKLLNVINILIFVKS